MGDDSALEQFNSILLDIRRAAAPVQSFEEAKHAVNVIRELHFRLLGVDFIEKHKRKVLGEIGTDLRRKKARKRG